jgi:hypothetical protein
MREHPSDRDFEVALVVLREGHAVARRSWAEARGPADIRPPAYIQIGAGRRLTGVWRGPPVSSREYRLSGEDLLATDWRVIPASELLAGERGRLGC